MKQNNLILTKQILNKKKERQMYLYYLKLFNFFY